jgi:Mg-chelatase subunit ChlD
MYFAGAVGIVALIAGVIWVLNLKPPTCFDQRKNQGEAGVDCGGVCAIFCPAQVLEPVVRWSRAFAVTDDLYNTVAFVENRNPSAGTRRISYVFKLFDANRVLITERAGVAFIPPNAVVPIFEGAIATGGRTPAQTTFEFTGEAVWERVSLETGQALTVENSELDIKGLEPRLAAEVHNNSIYTAHDIGVVAVVYDTRRNAVAVSRTVIDELAKDTAQSVVFTWPRAFEKRVEQCIVPVDVAVVMDTSGSMNNDGLNPPEPLSTAKRAATAFIQTLGLDDHVGLVMFATKGAVVQTLTNDFSLASNALASVAILPEEEQGATNIGEGIARAREILPKVVEGGQRSRAMIVLTDGLANAPDEPGGEVFATAEANRAKEEGIVIYTIGLGEEVNRTFLTDMASRPTQAYFAAESAGLLRIYEDISKSLCERGPAIIDIVPLASDLYFR